MKITRVPGELHAIRNAADDLADEASETDAVGVISASADDVSVSYLRGVQDLAEELLGIWDGHPLPDELATVYARAGLQYRGSRVTL